MTDDKPTKQAFHNHHVQLDAVSQQYVNNALLDLQLGTLDYLRPNSVKICHLCFFSSLVSNIAIMLIRNLGYSPADVAKAIAHHDEKSLTSIVTLVDTQMNPQGKVN